MSACEATSICSMRDEQNESFFFKLHARISGFCIVIKIIKALSSKGSIGIGVLFLVWGNVSSS